MTTGPTPVEVWAPAFEQAGVLRARLERADVFMSAEDWRVPGCRWCRLCEVWAPFAELDEHARTHDRERREWRKQRKTARDRDARARLRQITRLRKEARSV